MAKRLWQPRSSRDLAADVVERVLHTGALPALVADHTCRSALGGYRSRVLAALPERTSLRLMQGSVAAGGERYLDTAEQDLEWYQLNMLDVYALLLAMAAAVLGIAAWLLQRSLRALKRLTGRKVHAD